MPLNRAQIAALIAANLPNNVSKLITPTKHREVETGIAGAAPNIVDDLIAVSAGPSSAGKVPVTNGSGKLDSSFLPPGSSATWGAITGTLSAQTDLQNALNLKAPLADPNFTGQVDVDGSLYVHDSSLVRDLLTLTSDVANFTVPLAENLREITDPDSTTVLITDMVVDYKRTDAAALDIPDAGSGFAGQHLIITNSSADDIVLNGATSTAFFNGSAGAVASLTLSPGEAIYFVAENGSTTGLWRVIARYASVSGGAGNVVGTGPSVVGNIPIFNDTSATGIEDSGIQPIEAISVSTGSGDAGLLVQTNGSGLIDESFFPALPVGDIAATLGAAIITINSGATLTANRVHLCVDAGSPANYTPTLPSAASNPRAWVDVIVSASMTKLVTVNGDVYWAGESGFYISDGTNWIRAFGTRIAMVAKMMAAAGQALNNGSNTVLTLATNAINIGGMAASSTVTVRRAGTYDIGFYGAVDVLGSGKTFIGGIYINGSGGEIRLARLDSFGADTYSGAGPDVETLAAGDTVQAFIFINDGSRNTEYDPPKSVAFLSVSERIA